MEPSELSLTDSSDNISSSTSPSDESEANKVQTTPNSIAQYAKDALPTGITIGPIASTALFYKTSLSTVKCALATPVITAIIVGEYSLYKLYNEAHTIERETNTQGNLL